MEAETTHAPIGKLTKELGLLHKEQRALRHEMDVLKQHLHARLQPHLKQKMEWQSGALMQQAHAMVRSSMGRVENSLWRQAMAQLAQTGVKGVAQTPQALIGSHVREAQLSSRAGLVLQNMLKGFLAGSRAGGGGVAARAPYLVGEQGPELFVPSSSGHIVPHGQLQQNPSRSPMHVTMHVHTPDSNSFRKAQAQILAEMHAGLRKHSARLG